MSVFQLSKKEQILKWREFRLEISKMNEIDQINLVVNYWSKAPTITFAIDWFERQFPTPWEIINEGYYDLNYIAFLMKETLTNSGWEESRIKMCYIKTKENDYEGMVLIIDNKYLLNYSYMEVLNYDDYKDTFRFLRIDNEISGDK